MKRVLIYLFALLSLFSCRELEVIDYRFDAKMTLQTTNDSLMFVGESAILELNVENMVVRDPLYFTYSINGEKVLPLTLNDVSLPYENVKLAERSGRYLLKFQPSTPGIYVLEYGLRNSAYSMSDTLSFQVYEKPIIMSFDVLVHTSDTAYLKEPTQIDISFNILESELKKIQMHYLINSDENLRLHRNGVLQSDTIDFSLDHINDFVLEYIPEKAGEHSVHMYFNDHWGYSIDTTVTIISQDYRASFNHEVKSPQSGYINDTTDIVVSFSSSTVDRVYMDYDITGPRSGMSLLQDGNTLSRKDTRLDVSDTGEYIFGLVPPVKGEYGIYFTFKDDIGYISKDTIQILVDDYEHTFNVDVAYQEEVFIADTTVIESIFTSVSTDNVVFSYDIVGPQGNLYLYENGQRVPKDGVKTAVKEYTRVKYDFIAPAQTGTYTMYMKYCDNKGYQVSDTIEVVVPGYQETFKVEMIAPDDAFICDTTFFDISFDSVLTESVRMSYKINGSSQMKLYKDSEILSSKSILEIGEGSLHRFGFIAKKEGDYSVEIKLTDNKGYTVSEVILFSVSSYKKTFDVETSVSEISYIADSTYIELYFDEVLVDNIKMDYRINGSTQQKLYHNGNKLLNKSTLLEISNGSIVSLSYIPPREGTYQIDLTLYDDKGYTYLESIEVEATEYYKSFNITLPEQITTNIMHSADIELNFTSVECGSIYFDYTINGSNLEKLTYMGETLANSGNKLTPGIVQNFILEYIPKTKGVYNVDFRFYDDKGYSVTKGTIVTADDYKKTFDVQINSSDTVIVGSSSEIDIVFSNIDTDMVIMDYTINPSSAVLSVNSGTLPSNYKLDLQSNTEFPITLNALQSGEYTVSFTFKDSYGYLINKTLNIVSILGASFDYDVTADNIYLDESAAIALEFKNINTEKVYLSYKVATSHNNGVELIWNGAPISTDRQELQLSSQKSYILSFDPIAPEEKISISFTISDIYGYTVEKEVSFKVDGYETTFNVLSDSLVSTNVQYPASINIGFTDLKTDKIYYNYSINGSDIEKLSYKGSELPFTDNVFDVSIAKNYVLEYTPKREGTYLVSFEFFDSRGYIHKTGTTIVASGYKNSFSVAIPDRVDTDIMYPAEFDVVFSDLLTNEVYMDYSINGSDQEKIYYQGSSLSNIGHKFTPGIINIYTLSYTPTVKGTSNIGFRFYDDKGFEKTVSTKIIADDYRKTFNVDISAPKLGYVTQESNITLKFNNSSTSQVYLDYTINHNPRECLTYSGNDLSHQKHTFDLSLDREYTLQYIPSIVGDNEISLKLYDERGYSSTHNIIIPALEWGEADIKDQDLSLTVGDTYSLSYTTSPSSMSYSFSSSVPDVLSVTAKGKITAHKVGSSVVKLSLSNGMTDSILVNVHASAAQYDVMAVCSPSAGGNITGIGKYSYGDIATLTVNANDGYIFRRWDDDDTSNPRDITVTSAVVRTAYLDRLCSAVNVTPEEGVVNRGEELQLTAIVLPDDATNKNVTWSSSDNTIATVTSTGKVMTHKKGEVTITATVEDESGVSSRSKIKVLPNKYNVTIQSEEGGSTTPSGTFEVEEDSEIEISATADEHHSFSKWSDGNLSPSRTLTVTSDITLTAQMIPNNYSLDISVSPEDASQIAGSGEYRYGETVTLVAIDDNPRYRFSHWIINDIQYSTSQVDITVTGDIHAQAYYDYAVQSLAISACPETMTLGETHNLIANCSPSEAANKSVRWSITPNCGSFNNNQSPYTIFTPSHIVGPAKIECVSVENPSIRDSRDVKIYADIQVTFSETIEENIATLYISSDKDVNNAKLNIMYLDSSGNNHTVQLPVASYPQQLMQYDPTIGYIIEQVSSNSEYVTVTIN